ncbi:ChaN family lipoprotein [Pseudodesulfovibrio sp.]|uniref:ChaN family lipoprotein n=1 Tax=unclassified Pseudodesulfovibrio TaxID=2661612 RepID=UPI003AFF83AC
MNNRNFRNFVSVLAVALSLVLGACARHVETPPLDVTFLPQKGDFVSKYGDHLTLNDIADMALHVDYILVGEGHRNVWDHRVQQELLKVLAASDRPPSVGLEMVAVDRQHELDDFCKGQVAVEDLPEELDWKTSWGYPFSLFQPLFTLIRRDSLPVAGLNVPTSVARTVARKGLEGLTEEQRRWLPAEIVPPAKEQLDFLNEVYAGHDSMDADNATARERFQLVQSIWDSKMAEQAVRLRKQYDWPVFVVAGAGHVEYGWGIARRIRRFDPGARILLVMPWRGSDFDADAGDVFFYSPNSYRSKMGAIFTDDGRGGLLVEQVDRASRAAKAGLRPGDVLLEASGVALEHLYDLHRAGFKVHEADKPLVFKVRRGNDVICVDMGKLGVAKPKKAASSAGVSTKEETGMKKMDRKGSSPDAEASGKE